MTTENVTVPKVSLTKCAVWSILLNAAIILIVVYSIRKALTSYADQEDELAALVDVRQQTYIPLSAFFVVIHSVYI